MKRVKTALHLTTDVSDNVLDFLNKKVLVEVRSKRQVSLESQELTQAKQDVLVKQTHVITPGVGGLKQAAQAAYQIANDETGGDDHLVLVLGDTSHDGVLQDDEKHAADQLEGFLEQSSGAKVFDSVDGLNEYLMKQNVV